MERPRPKTDSQNLGREMENSHTYMGTETDERKTKRVNSKVCTSCGENLKTEEFTIAHGLTKQKECDGCWAKLTDWALKLMRPTNG